MNCEKILKFSMVKGWALTLCIVFISMAPIGPQGETSLEILGLCQYWSTEGFQGTFLWRLTYICNKVAKENVLESERSIPKYFTHLWSTSIPYCYLSCICHCYHIYSSWATIFYFSDSVHFFSQIPYIWDAEMNIYDGSLFIWWTIALSHARTES